MTPKDVIFQGTGGVDLLGLARELAMELRSLQDILKHYSIDLKTLENYFKQPSFSKLYEDLKAEWGAVSNTQERIRLKSLALTEASMPEMFRQLHVEANPLSAKAEVFKSFMKGAGLDKVEGQDAAGRISIVINTGAPEPVTIEARPLPIEVTSGEEMQ